LGKLPNKVSIEGHTDSKPFAANGNYGNWELSTDRANMARRLMQANGIGEQQVTQVRGYADQRLRKPADPTDPSNRRISVIVQYPNSALHPAGAPATSAPKLNPAHPQGINKGDLQTGRTQGLFRCRGSGLQRDGSAKRLNEIVQLEWLANKAADREGTHRDGQGFLAISAGQDDFYA